MRGFDRLSRLGCVLALMAGLTGVVTLSSTVPAVQAEEPALGCDEGLIQKTLENGAAWRMCARIHSIKGLVLERIEFKPATGDREYAGYKRVLDQIYLAQLNVPYDTGMSAFNDIPDYGFGGRYLVEQVPELCRGGTLDVEQAFLLGSQLVERTMAGICIDEVETGLASHSQESELSGDGPRFVDRGTALEVSSVSKISWYEYQQRLTFDDRGQIDVGLGATGDLAPGREYFPTDDRLGWPLGPPVDGTQHYGASHRHNAIYRVDFGIDGGERQLVEQWDHESPGVAVQPILHGAATERTRAFSSIPGEDHDERTWWRVMNPDSLNRDGHPRSYEIVNHNPTDRLMPVTSPLVSFTNDVACQEYADGNLHPDCYRQSVLDYVAGDDAPLTDPVAWVNVGFHHVDRDEDQSPMTVHWQSFQLVPRDFFAQSPATPAERQCINGLESGIDSRNRPCIATNRLPPTISVVDGPADGGPVGPGSALRASPGSWYINRTQWDYSYLWFRDGEPIVNRDADGAEQPAVGPNYVVTEPDQGTSLTVKVTASQTGFGSGTAESAAVEVPGVPKSTPWMRLTAASGSYGRAGTAVVELPAEVTGQVAFDLGGQPLGAQQTSQGRAQFELPATTPPGEWTLRATYPGGAAHHPVAESVTYVVGKGRTAAPRMTYLKRPTSKRKGRARIAIGTQPGLAAASGRAVLTIRGKRRVKARTTVTAGRATLRLPRLRKGTYRVVVRYRGDRNYGPIRSTTYRLRIAR